MAVHPPEEILFGRPEEGGVDRAVEIDGFGPDQTEVGDQHREQFRRIELDQPDVLDEILVEAGRRGKNGALR